MGFLTMWHVRPAKAQSSLRIRTDCSEPLLVAKYSVNVKLREEQTIEFLSLTRGCTGSSESTLVKMPHCWKSHAPAHIPVVLFKVVPLILTSNIPHAPENVSKLSFMAT